MFIKSICSIRNLIFTIMVLIAHDQIALSQNMMAIDSVNSRDTISAKTNQDYINYKIKSENFFRTDSVFSFRSQKGYVPSLIHNFGEQAAAPFKFNSNQWLTTGAVFVITAGLIIVDDNIDDWARTQKEEHVWVSKISPVVSELGDNPGIYGVIATGLLSAILQNEKGVQTSLLATQAMITSGVWVQMIKQLSGRERPKASYIFSGKEGGKWHGPFEKYSDEIVDDRSRFSYDAFPSGHTATAFSIATVFASQYNQTKAIPIISYSLASLVGISRMIEHEHWASDVFLGALFGYICGKQVVSHYNKIHQISPALQSKNKPQITFIQGNNQIGLSVIW